MTADTPAAIARRLTPAQRRALLWLAKAEKHPPRRMNASLWVLRRMLLADFMLRSTGLCWWNATPLGLAVRAECERMEAGDG